MSFKKAGMNRVACNGPVILFTAVFLSGCAAPLGSHQRAMPVEHKQVVLEVPFFSQNTDQCGPSALAGVLSYWGRNAEPSVLKKEIYRTRLKGSLTVDMLLAAEERGMSAEIINGSLTRVKKELDDGHPVIAFINTGFSFYPVGHYLVITGYDDVRQGIYAHSGTARNEFWKYKRFIRKWDKTDRLILLVLPAGR